VVALIAVVPLLLGIGGIAAGAPTPEPTRPPPFIATGATTDRGGVRSQAGIVTVTDPTDGPVPIDTTLYLPAKTPAAAVLLSHGFGGSKESTADQAVALARDGLVVLTWSAPGFGRSGGSISLMSLDHEIPDARQLIDHLAAQPQVRLDAPGDPRVGVAGGSYGGAASLLIAGTDPRVDAVVAAITWNDLAQALFPDETRQRPARTPAPPASQGLAGDGPLKAGWASSLFASGLTAPGPAGTAAAGTPVAGTQTPPACGRFRLQYCLGYTQAVTSGRLPSDLRALLARSSPAAVLGSVRAPTLLIQGEQDSLFGLDQAQANAAGLVAAGAPVSVHWYAGGHDAGCVGQDEVGRLTSRFLLNKLTAASAQRSATAGPPSFAYELTGQLDPTTGDVTSSTVTTDGYPLGAGGSPARMRSLTLSGPAQQVVRPPGGRPAAVTAVTGLGGAALSRASQSGSAQSGAGQSGRAQSGADPSDAPATGNGLAGSVLGPEVASPPGQTATFLTAPLSRQLTLTGQAQLTLTISAAGPGGGDGPLFGRLLDVAPDGSARLLGPGAAPFTVAVLPAGRPTEVEVSLPGAVVTVAAGHRLAISIATTDASFAVPATPAAYTIALSSAATTATTGRGRVLRVPTVPARGGVDPARVGPVIPRVPLIGGLVVLGLAAAGGVVLLGRRIRGRWQPPMQPRPRPETAAADPLVVTGLVKSYPDGFRAVDGVSFRVRPGQVLGLLGPNGAGKTTTLRMLMGLLRPSDGQILVFGNPVTPGAPVLARVGAFVEGPGLLPHLTGRGNLRSYWAATGRPEHEANLEQVLAIAGLGSAVDRRTRTYSQGMRQRLAIAQAMLGTPDLLVLDEPTNGLDPPQIAAMRTVIRRYAAGGRTVVLSSHLLAEVEQTCDHVVVMARGRVVADAATAELVGSGGPTIFEVDDAPAAARVLAGLPGVQVIPPGTPDGADSPDGPDVPDRADSPADSPTVVAALGGLDRQIAVAALVRAGIGVSGVRARNRLEDAFLTLVAPADTAPPTPSPVGASAAGGPR